MTSEWAAQPPPTAVHGRYVPGLPWDNLPPPVWEPDAESPDQDPLVIQLRKLADDERMAWEEHEQYEEDARDAEDRAEDLRREAEPLMAQFEKVNPKAAAELKKELDW